MLRMCVAMNVLKPEYFEILNECFTCAGHLMDYFTSGVIFYKLRMALIFEK